MSEQKDLTVNHTPAMIIARAKREQDARELAEWRHGHAEEAMTKTPQPARPSFALALEEELTVEIDSIPPDDKELFRAVALVRLAVKAARRLSEAP